MTTEYTQTATIAVPDPLIPDANQLALCLGESSADDQTFGAATTKTQAAICTPCVQQ